MEYQQPQSGQIAVAGVLGDPGNGFGGIPVKLLSNIPDAVQMRFGSTPDELARTEWQDYDAEATFWMRTGGGERNVYVEYKDQAGNITAMDTIVPAFDPALGTDYDLTPSAALQPEGSREIWVQDFSSGHGTWVSYDYNGGDPDGANYFYAASWNKTGGVDDGGYVWTDASRWLIDTPETPHSVLALLTYSQWGSFPDNTHLDLDGTTIEFHLRGDNLDLKGGEAYFWLVDDYGRWHQRDIVLDIGNGEWTVNSIDIGRDTAGWENSWTQIAEPSLNYNAIRSWGVAFVGFPPGVEPTGVLGMDEVTITRRSMNIDGTGGPDKLVGGRGDDNMSSGNGADILHGGEGNDSLRGGDGNDLLTGGEGVDNLEGGSGDDAYYVDAADTVIERDGEDMDIVYTTGSYQLGSNVEAVYMRGANDYVGTGNDSANWIYGDAGKDSLTGKGGNDLLDGGAGDDVLDGGAGSDSLRADEGDDRLIAGEGADTLEGGSGDDTYYVDSADTIVERDGEGLDIVYATGSYQLGTNVEAVYMRGANDYIGTGNDSANWIYGDAGKDSLTGNGGNDLLDGGAGDDMLDGGTGNDSLRGGDGNDVMHSGEGNDSQLGGAGNDKLVGGTGADRLTGGSGDDVYYVDALDKVGENENEGHDIVYANASYQLGLNVEAVYLLGDDDYTATGNNAANWIYGDLGNDSLIGKGGNDLLDGGAGDDVLDGGEGNDSLRGGSGTDVFVFKEDFGHDAVSGFAVGADSEDRIQFSIEDFADFAAVQSASTSYRGGTLITTGEHSVFLIDVDINSLHQSDFLLV